MVIAPLSLRKDYWESFDITDPDIEFLYNHLLEVERPLTSTELIQALVSHRIEVEKDTLEKNQKSGGSIFYPKDHYEVGQTIQFPHLDWASGSVVSIRPGSNPELPPFDIIEVKFPSGENRHFASGLEKHVLNNPVALSTDDPLLNEAHVLDRYGEDLEAVLTEVLNDNADLVRIGWRWFPRALLVDINVGHLNLAEAVLDMVGGGPLPTQELMAQIDLPSDAEASLNEFSLNLAMQEDKRFDEVGPSGEVLWFLHRLEPEPVREAPAVLRYNPMPNYEPEQVSSYFAQLDPQILDELEPGLNPGSPDVKDAALSLVYPHWRAGTLPLVGSLARLFPTAYESPRIQFTFVDGNSGAKFSGWVVRPYQYVFGLREWYQSQNLIPGSLVRVQRGGSPGEVIIKAEKKRPTREWIRTAVIGSDGGVVFSMLKHNISSAVHERMGMVVSNTETLDEVWERSSRQRGTLTQVIKLVMRELAKLSPQSHVHAEELYAAVNILRRCPPGPILAQLLESPWSKHLGNLYFRLDESAAGETE